MNTEHKEYLDQLKESEITNMLGAAPYLQDEFDLTRKEANRILLNWIEQ